MQIRYDEEELHDKTISPYLTDFDVATWPTPIPKTGRESYQNN